MAAVAGVSITIPKAFAAASNSSKPDLIKFPILNILWKRSAIQLRRICVRPAAAAPNKLSDKVEESIKNAEDACSENPISGECAAAWDEVEELSAAASHARDKLKESEPVENHCKDNPETEE